MAEWEGRFCKCKNCGKQVYVSCPEDWAYKMVTKRDSKLLFACSWGCLQALRKKYQEQGKYIDTGLEPRRVRHER